MGWIKDKIESFKAQRELARQVSPHSLKQLALEVRDLALLAAQLNPRSKSIQKLIRDVLIDMGRLSEMIEQPDFKRLSHGKRILLRQSLIASREQLIESIESAPSPTDTLQ